VIESLRGYFGMQVGPVASSCPLVSLIHRKPEDSWAVSDSDALEVTQSLHLDSLPRRHSTCKGDGGGGLPPSLALDGEGSCTSSEGWRQSTRQTKTNVRLGAPKSAKGVCSGSLVVEQQGTLSSELSASNGGCPFFATPSISSTVDTSNTNFEMVSKSRASGDFSGVSMDGTPFESGDEEATDDMECESTNSVTARVCLRPRFTAEASIASPYHIEDASGENGVRVTASMPSHVYEAVPQTCAPLSYPNAHSPTCTPPKVDCDLQMSDVTSRQTPPTTVCDRRGGEGEEEGVEHDLESDQRDLSVGSKSMIPNYCPATPQQRLLRLRGHTEWNQTLGNIDKRRVKKLVLKVGARVGEVGCSRKSADTLYIPSLSRAPSPSPCAARATEIPRPLIVSEDESISRQLRGKEEQDVGGEEEMEDEDEDNDKQVKSCTTHCHTHSSNMRIFSNVRKSSSVSRRHGKGPKKGEVGGGTRGGSQVYAGLVVNGERMSPWQEQLRKRVLEEVYFFQMQIM